MAKISLALTAVLATALVLLAASPLTIAQPSHVNSNIGNNDGNDNGNFNKGNNNGVDNGNANGVGNKNYWTGTLNGKIDHSFNDDD
ncbi:hypothetical protein G9A89_002306 [Geosiphon pyriformis]|nr:hypothetical protein G9A89_002306 [Geosiphon pyriformis]